MFHRIKTQIRNPLREGNKFRIWQVYGMQSPARRFYIGGAFVEDTDVAFRFTVQGNRKVDLEIASVVGQLVVVQADTGDGLVAAQVIFTFGALLKRNLHRRNTWEVNVNDR